MGCRSVALCRHRSAGTAWPTQARPLVLGHAESRGCAGVECDTVCHRLARDGTGKNTAADGSLTPSTLRLSSRPDTLRARGRPDPENAIAPLEAENAQLRTKRAKASEVSGCASSSRSSDRLSLARNRDDRRAQQVYRS